METNDDDQNTSICDNPGGDNTCCSLDVKQSLRMQILNGSKPWYGFSDSEFIRACLNKVVSSCKESAVREGVKIVRESIEELASSPEKEEENSSSSSRKTCPDDTTPAVPQRSVAFNSSMVILRQLRVWAEEKLMRFGCRHCSRLWSLNSQTSSVEDLAHIVERLSSVHQFPISVELCTLIFIMAHFLDRTEDHLVVPGPSSSWQVVVEELFVSFVESYLPCSLYWFNQKCGITKDVDHLFKQLLQFHIPWISNVLDSTSIGHDFAFAFLLVPNSIGALSENGGLCPAAVVTLMKLVLLSDQPTALPLVLLSCIVDNSDKLICENNRDKIRKEVQSHYLACLSHEQQAPSTTTREPEGLVYTTLWRSAENFGVRTPDTFARHYETLCIGLDKVKIQLEIEASASTPCHKTIVSMANPVMPIASEELLYSLIKRATARALAKRTPTRPEKPETPRQTMPRLADLYHTETRAICRNALQIGVSICVDSTEIEVVPECIALLNSWELLVVDCRRTSEYKKSAVRFRGSVHVDWRQTLFATAKDRAAFLARGDADEGNVSLSEDETDSVVKKHNYLDLFLLQFENYRGKNIVFVGGSRTADDQFLVEVMVQKFRERGFAHLFILEGGWRSLVSEINTLSPKYRRQLLVKDTNQNQTSLPRVNSYSRNNNNNNNSNVGGDYMLKSMGSPETIKQNLKAFWDNESQQFTVASSVLQKNLSQLFAKDKKGTQPAAASLDRSGLESNGICPEPDCLPSGSCSSSGGTVTPPLSSIEKQPSLKSSAGGLLKSMWSFAGSAISDFTTSKDKFLNTVILIGNEGQPGSVTTTTNITSNKSPTASTTFETPLDELPPPSMDVEFVIDEDEPQPVLLGSKEVDIETATDGTENEGMHWSAGARQPSSVDNNPFFQFEDDVQSDSVGISSNLPSPTSRTARSGNDEETDDLLDDSAALAKDNAADVSDDDEEFEKELLRRTEEKLKAMN